jgi:hypothetical protein
MQNADLTAQCRALLRTVEEYREQFASPAVQRAVMVSGGGGGVGMLAEHESIGKGSDAQSFITKQLLTFNNVEELQQQNQVASLSLSLIAVWASVSDSASVCLSLCVRATVGTESVTNKRARHVSRNCSRWYAS